jgi:hypothetical protein
MISVVGQLAAPLNEYPGQLRKSRSAGGPAIIESLQNLADRIEKNKIDNAGVKRSLDEIIQTLKQA